MSKFTPWTEADAEKWAHIEAEEDFYRSHGDDEEYEGWENEDFERGFEAGLAKAAAQIEKCETIHSCSENNYLTVWFKQPGSSDTHQAKLVGVREVSHE